MPFLFTTSILVAFVSGVLALFAPCCISFLLPAYLGQLVRSRARIVLGTLAFSLGIAVVMLPLAFGIRQLVLLFNDYHTLVYVIGGLLMVGTGVLFLSKISLPMPRFVEKRALGENVTLGSLFLLGVTSGLASSCCAPVLVGALTLVSLSPTLVQALAVGVSYVLGMVAPLFLAALFMKSAYLKTVRNWLSRDVHGTPLGNVMGGAVMLVFGVYIIVAALTGNVVMPAEGQQIGQRIYLVAARMNAFFSAYPALDVLFAVLLAFAGWLTWRAVRKELKETRGVAPATGLGTVSFYTCPMHPEVVRDQPGMCPECGMQLVPAKAERGAAGRGADGAHDKSFSTTHDKHAGHKTENFLKKFWVALALTVPILAYSELFPRVFGFSAPDFSGRPFVILGLGSVVYFYCGWIFIASAGRELRARLPGMMTLIALAITAAYAFSAFQVLRGERHNLLWELSTLIAIMLLGHWIEMRAVQGAQGALKELAKLLPDIAEVIDGDGTRTVSLADLRVGDVVLVRPGGKVPADGTILEGHSELNESIITGESKPVAKRVDDKVVAGAVNGDGTLRVSVGAIGDATFLAGVMRLVAEAQASKSRLQMLSDRAAFWLTILAVSTGTVTFAAWMVSGGGIVFAMERLVAVLVIACPHALGLAIPLVASISTTMAARSGFLIRQRLALEAARNIDIVLFDKTGTLTKGEFGIDAVFATRKGGEREVVQFAASVDNRSEHPIARAIVAHARKLNMKFAAAADFERIAAGGARALVDGVDVRVGNERLLAAMHIALEPAYRLRIDELSRQGKTVIHVVADKKLKGSIALVDVIRAESREAVANLKQLGTKVAMVTGDSEDVASWVAGELGLDEYFAKVLPREKSEKVKLLQAKGMRVAMVGDGVNDAPALTQADVGIAIGAGTNVAIESAGIILVKNDPRDIPKIVRLSKLTYTKMLQNLFWATGYNVVALPLAAGVLASQGIVLQPALAAALMSVSTVVVAANAMLLRTKAL